MGEPLSHKSMTSPPAGTVRVPAALQPMSVQTTAAFQATTGSKCGHAAALFGRAYLSASIAASRCEGHQLCRVRGSLGEAPHQVLPLGWHLPNGKRIAGRCRTGHMQQHASHQQPTASPGAGLQLRCKLGRGLLLAMPSKHTGHCCRSICSLIRCPSPKPQPLALLTPTPRPPTCSCSSWLFRSMAYAQARSACTSGMCRCLRSRREGGSARCGRPDCSLHLRATCTSVA